MYIITGIRHGRHIDGTVKVILFIFAGIMTVLPVIQKVLAELLTQKLWD